MELVEGKSLRSISRCTGLTYNNVCKKFLWLKKIVDQKKNSYLLSCQTLQFDELETIEHTKCKPLSIVLIVNENYQLLTAKVAVMPAKGRLAELSRRKYGLRKNQRVEKLNEAFSEVKSLLASPPILIKSDRHPNYRPLVGKYFPGVVYQQHPRVEKKKLQERIHEKIQKRTYDPIFPVNHFCARLRDRIKRLVRRSWCTTKKVENLQLNLDLFVLVSLGVLNPYPKSGAGAWDFGDLGNGYGVS